MNSAMRHPKLRILVTFHDIIPAMTDDRPAWRIEYGRIRKLGGGDYWKGQRLEDAAARSKMSPYTLGLDDHRSMREGIERRDTNRSVPCPFDDGTPEKAEYNRGWDALPLHAKIGKSTQE